MRILMLVPDSQMIDRRVLQQAKSLHQAGHSVTLLAGFECPRNENYELDGIDIHRYAYDWSDSRLRRVDEVFERRFNFLKPTARFVYRCLKPAMPLTAFDNYVLDKGRQFPSDVIHVHDLPLLKHAAILSGERSCPLVYDAHELYYEQDVLPASARKRLKREERRYMSQVDLFSTVSPGLAEYFESCYSRPALVIMNCTEEPAEGFDRDSHSALRQKAGLPDDAKIVLFQGWISPERNLSALVRSAEHIPPGSHIVVIGYGEYERELRAALEGKSWGDRVHFLGRVEADELLALTAGADIGVIPYLPIDFNHTHCAPNKFFEFVMARVPIVTHDLPFPRSMAEQFGMVAVGDLSTPENIGSILNDLLRDPERLRCMRDACDKAARVLNWRAEAEKLLAAYPRDCTRS